MLYAPINPADLLAVNAATAERTEAGNSIGAEGVGVVEQVGVAVSLVRPGDRVLPLSRGNWASHRVVDEADVVVVPTDIDLV